MNQTQIDAHYSERFRALTPEQLEVRREAEKEEYYRDEGPTDLAMKLRYQLVGLGTLVVLACELTR